VNRRTFLQQASGALLTLGSSASPAPAQTPATHVFYDPATLRHEPGGDHPENPKRLDAVMESVRALQRQQRVAVSAPRPATEDEILRVHTPDYLQLVRAEIAAGRRTLSTGDTELSSGSLAAAMAAAGTVVSAVDAVMRGRARNAFCAVRPPGHHASQARGMGFCVFNNLAIGARHAAKAFGVERILIADWDVHHGNGTQAIFWSDGSVLFFDTHQHPWYPGTGLPNEAGEGKGRGLIVNRPFPAGSGRLRPRRDRRRVPHRTVAGRRALQAGSRDDLRRLRLARRRSARPVHARRHRLRRSHGGRARDRAAARARPRGVGARGRLFARGPGARRNGACRTAERLTPTPHPYTALQHQTPTRAAGTFDQSRLNRKMKDIEANQRNELW
jgi:histone deacetylase-like protein